MRGENDSMMGTAILLLYRYSRFPGESKFSQTLTIARIVMRNLYLGDIWSYNRLWPHLKLCKRFRNALQLSCLFLILSCFKSQGHNAPGWHFHGEMSYSGRLSCLLTKHRDRAEKTWRCGSELWVEEWEAKRCIRITWIFQDMNPPSTMILMLPGNLGVGVGRDQKKILWCIFWKLELFFLPVTLLNISNLEGCICV